MRFTLLIIVVIFTLGMASPPPAPVCKYDPQVNSDMDSTIKQKCNADCVERGIVSKDCIDDCITFSKWGVKYSEDK